MILPKRNNNNRGTLTVDFLFSIVFASGIIVLFFSISFTFVIAEISQYIAFSAARAQAGGNTNPDEQRRLANMKYQKLIRSPQLQNLLFRSTWFSLDNPEIRTGKADDDFNSEYRQDEDRRIPYTGVRLSLQAQILDLKIPFLGSTSEGPGGFKAKVTGFVNREPSSEECFNQVQLRYEKIMKLEKSRFSRLPESKNKYISHMEDNGC